MEYIIETTKGGIIKNEPFRLPKYKTIENSLDHLITFKEIHKNETLNQILNDIIINKPTVISYQNYDILNTQRIKYEYLSKFLYEILFLDDDEEEDWYV